MSRRTQVVDHALERRQVLLDLRAGRVDRADACDASPYLLSAAKRIGTLTERPCPVCGRAGLHDVLWVYGDAVGDAAGTARTPAQLARLAAEVPDVVVVYLVEVCSRCEWNHLVRSWHEGTAGTAPARRSRRTAD